MIPENLVGPQGSFHPLQHSHPRVQPLKSKTATVRACEKAVRQNVSIYTHMKKTGVEIKTVVVATVSNQF
jgi:hypothetical protein